MFLNFLQMDLSITVVLSGDLYCKVVLVSVEKHEVQCERMHSHKRFTYSCLTPQVLLLPDHRLNSI